MYNSYPSQAFSAHRLQARTLLNFSVRLKCFIKACIAIMTGEYRCHSRVTANVHGHKFEFAISKKCGAQERAGQSASLTDHLLTYELTKCFSGFF